LENTSLGTCYPLLVLSGGSENDGESGMTKVTAETNFAVNEIDFIYPPPDGYGGIIPAVNTL